MKEVVPIHNAALENLQGESACGAMQRKAGNLARAEPETGPPVQYSPRFSESVPYPFLAPES